MTGLGSFSSPCLRGVAWGGAGPVGLLFSLYPASCLLLDVCFVSFPVSVAQGGDIGKAVGRLGRGTRLRVLSRAGAGGGGSQHPYRS